MAVDAFERLRQAEQLLKQGKASTALEGLRELAQRLPDDLPTLNRIGDLLVRYEQTGAAAVYYRKIATQFTMQGHVPKASAIYKKLLRVEADPTESLIELGRLSLRQKLHGEAASYLTRAAETMSQRADHVGAARVYELLIEAEPGSSQHRAALAGALAAGGDAVGAATQFLALGDTLGAATPDRALEAYRRAVELRPDAEEPVRGLAACLTHCGRAAEAITVLERAVETLPPSAALLGELVLAYEAVGRTEDTQRLFARAEARAIDDGCWERMFGGHLSRGDATAAWNRLGPILDHWAEQGQRERIVALLERLGRLEPGGHLPALTRLLEQLSRGGDRAGSIAVLQNLARVYRERGMPKEEEASLARLRALQGRAAGPAAAAAADDAAGVGAGPPRPEVSDGEAPAVPLNRAQRELVSGRLTQAEILEKYGLQDQALQQLREVVGMFPGHVDAQRRMAQMLRASGGTRELIRVLASLAVAARASGDLATAREAIAEALAIGAFPPPDEQRLKALGLLEEPPRRAAPRAPAVAQVAPGDDDDVVIEFDLDAEDLAPEAEPTRPPPAAAVAVPPPRPAPIEPPAAEAVEFAAEPSGAELSPSEERAARLGDPAAEAAAEPDAANELRAIAAALDAEFVPAARGGAKPGEDSVDEVLSAFKREVEAQVAGDDYRTHYELGLGYKEMGLIAEAIAEFEISAGTAELARESQVMLALCFREQGELDRAVDCYRGALDAPCDDAAAEIALRYDFGDLLTVWGDLAGALEMFRAIEAVDPAYRDVAQRIAGIERPAGG